MKILTKDEKLILLNQVFSPTAPIKQKDFFHGRMMQLTKIMDAINEAGQHAILHGERGVGKTSLAYIMMTSYTNLYPVKITCSRDDDFKTLWQQTFNNIQFSQTTQGIGFNAEQKNEIINIGQRLNRIEVLKPSDIVNLLNQLPAKFLLIFDEFDNINSKKTKSLFADLIKSMSDNVPNATIVLVGIADNVEDLVGQHQSLERCLKQVKMPRMSAAESSEIIESGLEKLQISINRKIK